MSTITGVAPNALHIAPPNQDMANNASLLREQDKNAFAPVEESSATDHSKNQPAENPSRQAERQSDRELQTDLSRLLKESRLSNENRVTENINQEKPETLESRPLNSKPAETVSRSPDNSSIKAETAVSEEVVSKELSRDQLNDGAKEQDLSKQARESVESRRDQRELQMDQQKIAGLKQRDREVKNHEQAHKAVGGQYAGAMSLDYERGPDGVNYAVAGEVQINLSRSADNPEADLIKAQQGKSVV